MSTDRWDISADKWKQQKTETPELVPTTVETKIYYDNLHLPLEAAKERTVNLRLIKKQKANKIEEKRPDPPRPVGQNQLHHLDPGKERKRGKNRDICPIYI